MPESFVVGALGIAILAGGWLAVQQAWQRSFPEAHADPDPLAGRMGCHGCAAADECERHDGRRPDPTPDAKEENR